jgi:Mg2+-importing ATPase
VILAILIASTLVSFFQDRRAEHTVARLRARVQTRSLVVRDGSPVELPAVELVPGDVIQLGAGALVPADAIVLEASDFS